MHDPIKELTQIIKEMRVEHALEVSVMWSRLIQMEQNQNQNIQPKNNNDNRGNNNPWPRRKPPSDQRPPTPLEAANVADHPIPFFRPCANFHEESACAIARKNLDEGTNEHINNVIQN